MCYMILLSTDRETDLTRFNSTSVVFEQDLPPLVEVQELKYRQKWFVGSRDGCSCGFRHLHENSTELGFDEPVDWYPEEPEDVEATLEFADIIMSLLKEGAHVDCIDVWGHETDASTTIEVITVDLSSMPSQNFRFMEGRHFVFE